MTDMEDWPSLSPVSRLQGRQGSSQAIADRIRAGFNADVPPLVMAPEGVTTNGRALIRFHTGAFIALEPVLPVLLRYGHE